MELATSQEYANFRAWVPRNMLTIGLQHPQQWLYYDWGPRSYPEPIVCIHSLVGSPESFFQQLIHIAPRGYRILSLQIPVYWTVAEFCDALHVFFDTLQLKRIHLIAAGLGGFLALHYAVRRPDRVTSLLLIHSFLSTEGLNNHLPYTPPVLRWLPDFLVRSTMRTLLPAGRTSTEQAAAAHFAITHTMSGSRDLVAARLALFATTSSAASRLHIPEHRVTLLDTLDRPQTALEISERTAQLLPAARRALLKNGGDFPYLSVPEDVNVHLIVHLRRNAAPPDAPLPLPPPARRRRQTSTLTHLPDPSSQAPPPPIDDPDKPAEDVPADVLPDPSEEPSVLESNNSPPAYSDDALRKEAIAIVVASERARIERLTFEIARLRDNLPHRDDQFLAAALHAVRDDLPTAVAEAELLDEDDSLHTKYFEGEVQHVMSELLATRDSDAIPLSPSPSATPRRARRPSEDGDVAYTPRQRLGLRQPSLLVGRGPEPFGGRAAADASAWTTARDSLRGSSDNDQARETDGELDGELDVEPDDGVHSGEKLLGESVPPSPPPPEPLPQRVEPSSPPTETLPAVPSESPPAASPPPTNLTPLRSPPVVEIVASPSATTQPTMELEEMTEVPLHTDNPSTKGSPVSKPTEEMATVPPIREPLGVGDDVSGKGEESPQDDMEKERLRAWSMSAHTASRSVTR